jgi:phosphoenolpyruvate carboxykinase (ATP)
VRLLENVMAIGLKPRTDEIAAKDVLRNPTPALLYEHAVAREGAAILSSGALATFSGAKTGRSPQDKRIVQNPESSAHVWWGPVNIPASGESFMACRRQALDDLNGRGTIYVVDGYAGWDLAYRIKVRVICARAYHALFMHNLLIRPTRLDLETFGDPDFVIFNAGDQPADRRVAGVSSATSVMLNLERREMVILGTNYAGEMKKGIFTALNYWMPEDGVLSMHCSANEGSSGETTLFFGLSGTGKTTLSSDPRRPLIGDDEHCWSDRGIFNIEGGCYAKCLGLSAEQEPQIFRAVRFGAVLENVVFDADSRAADYKNSSLTENTRACYPIEHIESALVPCLGPHPTNMIFLTCDAFGVLPPVSRLSIDGAMYHFLSGYTAKLAGTEVGIVEPQATFSACFGAAFMVLHPARYAELLAEKMRRHETRAWLLNTGWSGGPYGTGSRIKLGYTRAIIDAIHDGVLSRVPAVPDSRWNLEIPSSCPGVHRELLQPRGTWADPEAYDRRADQLAAQFRDNFAKYADLAPEAVRKAGPRV